MIDWPNLIVGFAIGLVPWVIDRVRARSDRRKEALQGWLAASKAIELAAWKDGTTAGDIMQLRVQYPIDNWRLILGDTDFRLLEDLERAFMAYEHERDLLHSLELGRARAAFANMARLAQSESYQEVAKHEERLRLRRDYLRYPIRTWKRERRNRVVRRASLPRSDGSET